MTALRYRELTYRLRGLIFETRKKLKTGWSEEIYHQGLVQLLQEQDIPVEFKPRKAIIHRGVEVHLFECDLIVWDLIILELKVLPFTTFAPAHYAQLIHYLKCWGKDLGLLVNFGSTRAQIERVVWDEPVLEIYQNHDPLYPIWMIRIGYICAKSVKAFWILAGNTVLVILRQCIGKLPKLKSDIWGLTVRLEFRYLQN